MWEIFCKFFSIRKFMLEIFCQLFSAFILQASTQKIEIWGKKCWDEVTVELAGLGGLHVDGPTHRRAGGSCGAATSHYRTSNQP